MQTILNLYLKFMKIQLFFKKSTVLIFFSLLFFSENVFAQDGFTFIKENKKRQRVSFRLINNLVVIPLEINGKKLSFILDSGVSKTILFNITENEIIGLNNVEKVALRGLGKGEAVDALLSKNNKLSLNGLESYNETIYVILKDYFDLSSKMGVTIHGIIGYNLLENFVTKINYNTQKIVFYKPNHFTFRNCKKCEILPIQFHRKKPYINTQVQLDTVGSNYTDVKLLVDSGGSDAIWLFEHTQENIKTPKRFFTDILGEGLSGAIYGNRSRIPKLKINSFEIEKPTVSFLDSISTKNARSFTQRNGSLGAGILTRFKVWFDYPNQRLLLKKNASFKKGFNYNMSGLDVVYNGKKLVKEEETKTYTDGFNQQVDGNNSVSFITSFSYKFKPSFRIKNVIKNSPADKAGLKIDDLIIRLNNKPAHEYTLGEIIDKFQEKDKKKIRITIERKGQIMKFQFNLEKRI